MSLPSQSKQDLPPLVLRIDKISVGYQRVLALQDISLTVEEGDYLGIIGPNGGGKTTLLKAILGLLPLSSGDIRVFGKKPGKTGKQVAYVPQGSQMDRNFPISVQQLVMIGRLSPRLTWFHRYCRNDREAVDALLHQVGIYHLKHRMIDELSGGEFQKVLIARALAVEPRLLLLDEPTAHVDASSRDHIFSLLHDLNQHMTIILVTHELFAISSYVKTLACINRLLVHHGDRHLNQEMITKLYGCPVDMIAHGVPHRVLNEHAKEVS